MASGWAEDLKYNQEKGKLRRYPITLPPLLDEGYLKVHNISYYV